jgi:valyl-tRNA synthetase
MRADWPQANPVHQDRQIENRFNRFQATLSALREIRSRQGIAPRQHIDFSVRCDAEAARLLSPMETYFESMAQARNMGWGPQVQAPGTCATVSTEGMHVYVDLKDLIDVDAEIQRNEKQLEKLNSMITGKEQKLSNRNFVEKAPADVVQRERDSLSELQSQRQTVTEALIELRKSE